jgi:hypothetical protein
MSRGCDGLDPDSCCSLAAALLRMMHGMGEKPQAVFSDNGAATARERSKEL